MLQQNIYRFERKKFIQLLCFISESEIISLAQLLYELLNYAIFFFVEQIQKM